MNGEEADNGFDPTRWLWGYEASKQRILHTMLRVKDIDASLRFYVDGLGMKVIDRIEIPERRAAATFLGFGGFSEGATLELASYLDGAGESYSHGTGYGHVAIGVLDIRTAMAKLEAAGAEVTLRPKRFFSGGPLVSFVKDPDGYSVELVQTRRD